VELYGQARLLAGVHRLHLPGASLAEVLGALASACPALVGPVLTEDGVPTPAYALNLNGLRFCADLSEAVGETDQVLVISSLAGG
jgi:molybdopterin converting factor small subunit